MKRLRQSFFNDVTTTFWKKRPRSRLSSHNHACSGHHSGLFKNIAVVLCFSDGDSKLACDVLQTRLRGAIKKKLEKLPCGIVGRAGGTATSSINLTGPGIVDATALTNGGTGGAGSTGGAGGSASSTANGSSTGGSVGVKAQQYGGSGGTGSLGGNGGAGIASTLTNGVTGTTSFSFSLTL
jgi:hypothetical protein